MPTDNYLIKIQLDVQRDRAFRQLTQDMEGVAKAAPKMSKSLKKTQIEMRQTGRGLQNVSYQLQDVIVQTSNGVDVFRSLSQQLPQMMINMGAFGAVVGVAAAAIPLLISALRETDEEVKSLDDALGELSSTVGEIGSLPQKMDFNAWIEQWGGVTTAVRETNLALLEFQLARAEAAATRTGEALGAEAEEEASLTFMDKLIDSLTIAGIAAQGLNNEFAGLDPLSETLIARRPDVLEKPLERMAKRYGITKEIAREFNAVLQQGADLSGDQVREELRRAGAIKDANEAYYERIAALVEIVELRDKIASGRELADQARNDEVPTEQGGVSAAAQAAIDANDYIQMQYEVELGLQKLVDGYEAEAEAIRKKEEALRRSQIAQLKEIKVSDKAAEWRKDYNAQLRRSAQLYAQMWPEAARYEQALKDLKEAREEGIISQAEYNDRVVEAKDAYRKATQGLTLLEEGANLFSQSFDTMLDGVLMGTQTLSDGFKDMATVITAQLTKIIAKQLIFQGLMSAGAPGLAGLFANENGNAFAGGNVIPFARGGVVNGPTVFPMANGMGLMGEAGPEAVMPLTRGSDGKLGVVASGAGTTVNVYNQTTGSEAEVRRSGDGVNIDVIIKDKVNAGITSGAFDKSMRSSFGLGRKGS